MRLSAEPVNVAHVQHSDYPFEMTRLYRVKPKATRACELKYCTVQFVPKRPGQRFCSRAHSFKWLRSRWRGLHDSIAATRGYHTRREREGED